MSWFKREKPVCEEATFCITCGLHYKPRPYDEEFPSYCANCRKPHKERADSIALVKQWAEANFEKLEPRAKKWKTEKDRAWSEANAAELQMREKMRPQAAQMMGYGSELGHLFGGPYGRGR